MPDTTQKNTAKNLELVVDNIPYQVRITPETFNDEKRYRIVINGDEGHLYAWDSETVSLRALDDDAATLPDGLEKEISNLLVKTTLL